MEKGGPQESRLIKSALKKLVLSKVEEYLAEMGECVPKFCPNCGKPLINVSARKIWVMPQGEKQDRVDTFDVYCNECEWSGHISPDSLDVYYETKGAQ